MSGGTCDATSFPVGVEYSKVCGRIKAYQVGPSVAFFSETEVNINEQYLDGISLTHGGIVGNAEGDATSFSAGSTDFDFGDPSYDCPCNNNPGAAPPSFVGEDYFCESAYEGGDPGSTIEQFFNNDLLWDGKGCLDTGSECCSRVDGPYFTKQLEEKTRNPIDVRICGLNLLGAADYAIELIEIILYVQ